MAGKDRGDGEGETRTLTGGGRRGRSPRRERGRLETSTERTFYRRSGTAVGFEESLVRERHGAGV